jgi:uncharacterized membrane protein YhaH (DUF805 family)
MKPKISDLWRWNGELSRGAFLFWGVLLAAIKFNLDRFIAYEWFGQQWTIFDLSTLRLYLWQSPLQPSHKPYLLVLLATSIPFIWTGTLLTLRRLRSLGWRPWWVLLFFVPVVKLFFFAVLCLLPTREKTEVRSRATPPPFKPGVQGNAVESAILAILFTALLAAGAAWVGTEVFRDYGWSIFVGLPFCMGFVSSLIYGLRQERSVGACLLVANLTVLLAGVALLFFAFEGILCLLMAAPIAFGIATVGGLLGYVVQKTFVWRGQSANLFCSILVLLPLAMELERRAPPSLSLLQVKSSVIIDAPPETVWKHVVTFAELPPPKELLFKIGVAYPIRAEIHGTGVGAVRYCNFSTGPFVEPIQVWDEPKLLKFSVSQNPEPLQEWTPYKSIHPAHLDGYLASQAGQFRLVPLDGGRTLLEGTTWYYHHLWPADYWQLWSDHIIHKIHLRVLNHVKNLSEADKS